MVPWKQSESEPMQPVSTQPSPQRINPERAARVHKDSIVAAETPCKEDSSQVSSSQAHILNALRLMGCKEHENSIQRLRPNIDARCHVLHVTETDIQATAMKRYREHFSKRYEGLGLGRLVTSKFAAKM